MTTKSHAISVIIIALSNKARQFVADLVFEKQVRVVKQDVDRYGRIVGIVYIRNYLRERGVGQKWFGLGVPVLLQAAGL